MRLHTGRIAAALVGSLLLTTVAHAGAIVLTGHDADDHAIPGNNNAAGAQTINKVFIQYITDPLFNPFTASGINRFLFVTSQITPPLGHADTVQGLLSSGFTYGDFYVADAPLLDQALDQLGQPGGFNALVVASDDGGILTSAELSILNARAADIANFVNHGGGLYVLPESNDGGLTRSGQYAFLPCVGANAIAQPGLELGDLLTPFGATLNPTGLNLTWNDINGNFYHELFCDLVCGLQEVDEPGGAQCPNATYLTLAGRVPVCIPPPVGMLGWWTFDEPSIAHLADSIAGHDGHEFGPIVSDPDYVGRSRRFNGLDNYVWVNQPTDGSLDFGWGLFGGGDFSIDAWIRLLPDPTNNPHPREVLVQKMACGSGPESTTGWGYALSVDRPPTSFASHLSLGVNGDVFTTLTTFRSNDVGALTDGNWHHIAVTVYRQYPFDVHFYVDGLDVDDELQHSPVLTMASLINNAPFIMGENWCNKSDHLLGNMDELEVFGRTLSADEVDRLYRADRSGKCKCDSSQCSDGNPCTVDRCDPYNPGACQHFPEQCLDGMGFGCVRGTCDPSYGGCLYASLSCDDFNACTIDACVEPVCTHTRIDNCVGKRGGTSVPKTPVMIP